MIPAQLPGNDLVRMRGGGAAPTGGESCRPVGVRCVRSLCGFPFQPQSRHLSPGASARLSVSEQARPGRKRHREPGAAATAAAAAVAGPDGARAGEGGRRTQPPSGQRPRRASVVAAGAPGPPVVPRDQLLVR